MSQIPPGKKIGILGSGQLGRMLAQAARLLNYKVHVYSPEKSSPAEAVADKAVVAAYDDFKSLDAFAAGVDVLTFEFENVSVAPLKQLSGPTPVRPNPRTMEICQHRKREKEFLRQHQIPCAPFACVSTADEMTLALKTIRLPAILKTAGFGYDGKGQTKIEKTEEGSAVFAAAAAEYVLEQRIDLAYEFSIIGARSLSGAFAHWGAIRNDHADHILDISSTPAEVPAGVEQNAVQLTEKIMTQLETVGLLCVEFFVDRAGNLLVNEMAPRPHNSGHLTMEAFSVSQFSQQIRVICGYDPLPVTRTHPAAAMANLLGDLWANGEPRWERLAAFPDVHLHLYGKKEARAKRKMGHLTALAPSVDQAIEIVKKAREAIVV